MVPGFACISAHGSPVALSRCGTVTIVKSLVVTCSSSSQPIGQETVAPGRARGL